jgi:hypothetical protein
MSMMEPEERRSMELTELRVMERLASVKTGVEIFEYVETVLSHWVTYKLLDLFGDGAPDCSDNDIDECLSAAEENAIAALSSWTQKWDPGPGYLK